MSKIAKWLVSIMIFALPLVGLTPKVSLAKPAQETKKEELVYTTTKGKKYHQQGCRFIKNREADSLSEEEAIAKGLVPCGRCFAEKSQAKQ